MSDNYYCVVGESCLLMTRKLLAICVQNPLALFDVDMMIYIGQLDHHHHDYVYEYSA